ncbi:MAG TPA: cytidine deaminase [Bacteroidia bacterium]|jgi:cytidine deaminase|nr:cytidine deaminase [Bacteroidia bacterium]
MKAKTGKGTYDHLKKLATQVQHQAYAPYSKFHVGAALLTVKGNIYTGCNVENASFGLTSCAERNAIFRAIAEEGPDMKIEAIAVSVNSSKTFPPCGACRQVIAEFINKGKKGTTVIFDSPKGSVHRKLDKLLPDSFVWKK